MDKRDLINAIRGIGVPYGGLPEEWKDYFEFSGNQWNESWRFVNLDSLSEVELKELYETLKAMEIK